MSLKRGKILIKMFTYIVASFVGIVIHCATLCEYLFEQKKSVKMDF